MRVFMLYAVSQALRRRDADEIRERPDLVQWLDDQLAKYEAHYSNSEPERTDDREAAAPYLEPVYTSHDRSVFTHKEMHAILIERFWTGMLGV